MVIGCNFLVKEFQFFQVLLLSLRILALYTAAALDDFVLVDEVPDGRLKKLKRTDCLIHFLNVIVVVFHALVVAWKNGFSVEHFGAAGNGFVLTDGCFAPAVAIVVVCCTVLIHFSQIDVGRPHIGIQTGHSPQSSELSCILGKGLEFENLTARINQAERMIYSDLNLRPDNLYCCQPFLSSCILCPD